MIEEFNQFATAFEAHPVTGSLGMATFLLVMIGTMFWSYRIVLVALTNGVDVEVSCGRLVLRFKKTKADTEK